MGSHALALFVESGGSFDAEGEFSEANMREAFGVEEGEMLTYPLAIMPPSSITSEGTSLRSTARTKVVAHKTATPRKTSRNDAPPTTANKKKAPVDPYVVTPSGSLDSRFLSSGSTARSNPSYTVVGIRKPGGGCGKGLVRKPPLAPPAPAPAPKTNAQTPLQGGDQTGCQVTLICLLLPLASQNASAKIPSLGGSHTDFLAIQIMSRSGKARALSPRLGLLCGHYVV